MRVVEAKRFGGPEVLAVTTAPDPVAGPGQAVIGVAAADVLFLDRDHPLRAGLVTFFPFQVASTFPATRSPGVVTDDR